MLFQHAIPFSIEFFLLVIIVSYCSLQLKRNFFDSDFRVFYSAANVFRKNPGSLYDIDLQQQTQLSLIPRAHGEIEFHDFLVFINPPYYLFHYIVVSRLPPAMAYLYLRFILLVFLGFSLLLLIRLFPPRVSIWRLLLFSVSFAPIYDAMLQAQSGFLSLFIITIMYILFVKKKYFLAGLVGALLTYKIQLFFVFLMYFLLLGKRKLYAGLLTGLAVLTGSWFLFMGQNFYDYVQLNFWYVFLHEAASYKNILTVSWQGFFATINFFYNPDIPVRIPSVVMSLGTILVVLLSIPRNVRRDQIKHIFSLIIFTTLLSGMHVHAHDSVILLFPLYVLFSGTVSRPVYALVILGWIIFLFTIFTPVYPYPLFFLTPFYLAACVVLWLQWFKRDRQEKRI